MPSASRTDVRVLIPAYNEERHIFGVVSAVRALGYPVLVVDDGSSDRTAELARQAGAEVIVHCPNRGKGAALRTGFSRFLEGPERGLIVMDADGQHEAESLPAFERALTDGVLDVAVGNRMDRTAGMPGVRVATNRFMSWLISAVAGQRIEDTQCGYRAYRRAVIERLRLTTDHFETETEILFEAGRMGFRIGSVPVRTVYADEKSSIRPVRDTARFFAYLLRYLARPKSKS